MENNSRFFNTSQYFFQVNWNRPSLLFLGTQKPKNSSTWKHVLENHTKNLRKGQETHNEKTPFVWLVLPWFCGEGV